MAIPAPLSVAFDDTTLEPEPTWTEIDQGRSFEIARGRTSELDKTGTGTARITTFDTDGTLDPTNTGSPYAGKLDPVKQAIIQIVNPYRLLAEADTSVYPLFRGYVDTWGDFEVHPSGRWIEGTVQLEDALALFAALQMMPGTHGDTPPAGSEGDVYFPGGPNGYTAGTFKHVDTRQADVLDMIGYGEIGVTRGVLRDIFSGNVSMLEQLYARADEALGVLDDCADAETGGLVANRFIGKDGTYNFRGRFARFFPENAGYNINHWYLGGTPQAQADGNVVVISRLPAFRRSAQDIINASLAIPSGASDDDVPGNLVTDSASITQFGYRSRETPNLLTYQGHNDDLTPTTAIEETRKFADYRTGNYKDPKTRVVQIEVTGLDPRHPLAPAVWDFLCEVELSDLVSLDTLGLHPGGGGFDEDFFVEGIHYSCDPAPPPKYYEIVCTLDVSPRSLFDYNPFGEVDEGVS